MIELNTATEEELLEIGIPESDVDLIITHRTEDGPIESREDPFLLELSEEAQRRIEEEAHQENLSIDPDQLHGFAINFRPTPPASGHPTLEVELTYRTREDEEKKLTRSFSFEDELEVKRFGVNLNAPIVTRVFDFDGQPYITRTFDSGEIDASRGGSIFYAEVEVNTLVLTAPEYHRLVRDGRYLVASDPTQRFDGYRLTMALIRSETEQQATAALLGQENGLASGAVEIGSQDVQSAIHLSALNLSSASFDFEGSFSIDRDLEGEPSEYSGWAWLLAGPSIFFGYQHEQTIATPKHDITIPLPTSDLPLAGDRKEVPYDVSEEALLERPDIFADDPGTTCKPFDNPGRILGERRFNTILRVTQPDIDQQESGRDDFVENPRPAVEKGNAIDWEEDTTKYQAQTVSRGHIIEFRVRWRSNGYSLGNVAHSLTLAPRQTRRIVKVDYERRERAARREETISSDEVEQATIRDRDYSDAVQSGLSEWSRGGSRASVTAGAGGIGVAAGPVVIGGGAAHSRSSSSSWQRGGRNVSASEQQNLRDSIRQYGDSLRSLESTVVTEAEQEESVEGVSEVVRNINYCHALSIIYYEILRHLRVDTEVGGVRECLFVPLRIREFDDDRIAKHSEVLQRYVRSRAQRNALRYVEDIQNNFPEGSNVPEGTRNEQELTYLNGSIDLQLSITRPREGEVAEDVEEGTRREFSETERFRKLVEEYEKFAFFLPKSPTEIVHDIHTVTESERDRYFQRNIAPHMARRFADQLEIGTEAGGSFSPLDADLTLSGGYRYGRTMKVDFTVDVGEGLSRKETETLVLKAPILDEDPDTLTLPPHSVANVTRGRISFATDHYRRRNVYSDRGARDLVKENGSPDPDGADLRFPFSSYEEVDLREELRKAYTELTKELNQDIYRYHKAVWWNMDRDALYTLLDGFAVSEDDGRSIASLVERRPIGILGNTLVFRVSASTLLDPDFKTPEALLAHYRAGTAKSDPLRVSLPTSGLYARAHMDDCNACEEHQGSQDWVLADPDPELADLPASLLQSRRSQPTGLAPTQFPETLINLQNAPAAPEPAGLADALEAVTSGDAFRDMAGLAGTQQAAVAGLQTAANLANAFGQKALAVRLADMGADANAAKNVAAMAAATKRAVEKGQMTQNTAKEVMKNFADKMTKGQGTDAADSVAETAKELLSELGGDGSATLATADESGASFASFTDGTSSDSSDDGDTIEDEDDEAGTKIIWESDVSDEVLAFYPSRNDKSGEISMKARIVNAPSQTRIEWSQPSAYVGDLDILSPANLETKILAKRPGTTELDLTVYDDNTGSPVASQKLYLNVPQFVTVDESKNDFEDLLDDLSLLDTKVAVVERIHDVSDLLLSTANVRLVWKLPPYNEVLPSQFNGPGPSLVTTATIRGSPPSHRAGLFGVTKSNASGIGPTSFDEIIDLYPGAYQSDLSLDIDEATKTIMARLEALNLTDARLKSLGIDITGRLIGETLSHEVIHSLIGVTLSGGAHNVPPVINGIMNRGRDRQFVDRTGIEVVELSSNFPDPGTFHDNGIGRINVPTGKAQKELSKHFPVPPTPIQP